MTIDPKKLQELANAPHGEGRQYIQEHVDPLWQCEKEGRAFVVGLTRTRKVIQHLTAELRVRATDEEDAIGEALEALSDSDWSVDEESTDEGTAAIEGVAKIQ